MRSSRARKKVVVLGSTGSIGRNTLKIVEIFPEDFEVVGLSAGQNDEELAGQALKFRPRAVALAEPGPAEKLAGRLQGEGFDIRSGQEGISSLVEMEEVDLVVSAIVGSPGLIPTHRAVRAGVDVALANKEPLVMAGALIMSEAERSGASIIPVDSEHHALFTALKGLREEEVAGVSITASGGPFLEWSREEMKRAGGEEALNHPRWKMGSKITVDSATLMNKGLEIIEARWLFDLEEDRIGVLVHPESIVHGLVHLVDGGLLAYLSRPDMRLPIAAAMHYPEKHPAGVAPVDLLETGGLTFLPPDHQRFPAINMAREALRAGGTAPAVLNAANEEAVEAFLRKRIRFTDIYKVIGQTLRPHEPVPAESLEEILDQDRQARETARKIIEELNAGEEN